MFKTKIELSIVIPVYNSSNNLIRLIKEIFSIGSLKKIKKEVILVNDFSNLQTQILLDKIKKKYKKIKIINLKKNSGQHYSTLVGIDHSRGKFIATLDDDLEHSPKNIYKMISYLKKYNYDVVFENNNLNKNFFRNLSSRINQYLIKKVFNLKNNITTSSYRLITREFAKKLLNQYYYKPNISCMILEETHNVGNLMVNYKTAKTKSRYSITDLLSLNRVVIFDYSNWIFKFILKMLIISCFLAIIFGSFAFYENINKLTVLPGWTSTILSIIFFSFVIIISQFVLVSYFGRVINKKKFKKFHLK